MCFGGVFSEMPSSKHRVADGISWAACGLVRRVFLITRSEVRAWWAAEQRALLKLGVAGIWNDMNEPAVFDRPNKTLDPLCRHHTDFGPRRHAEVHNVYGQLMAEASHQGMRNAAGQPNTPDSNARPLVITRAGYTGHPTACHRVDRRQFSLMAAP